MCEGISNVITRQLDTNLYELKRQPLPRVAVNVCVSVCTPLVRASWVCYLAAAYLANSKPLCVSLSLQPCHTQAEEF